MASTSWQTQLRGSVNRPGRRIRKEERKRPKKPKAHPPWDDTTTDLTAYKPSPGELARRHELHKPTPLSERIFLNEHQTQFLQEDKENMFTRKTVYQENVDRKKALIKEIFHNQERELRNVLVETDRTMNQVKDMFGDDPMKFKGIPYITSAPGIIHIDKNSSVLALDPETPSRLTALSDSVMIHPALNEIRDQSDKSSNDDDSREENSFEYKLDLNYYKNLIHEEQNRKQDGGISQFEDNLLQRIVPSGAAFSRTQPVFDGASNMELDSSSLIVKPSRVTTFAEGQTTSKKQHRDAYSAVVLAGAPGTSQLNGHRNANFSAANTNTRNQELKDKDWRREPSTTVSESVKHGDSNSSLNRFEHMKQALNVLEEELSMYEYESKHEQHGNEAVPERLTGDASPLINIMVKLIRFLKESEVQIQAERIMHQNLLEEFQEQRALVDALTGDLINTQEQNCLLQEDLEAYKRKTNQEIDQLKSELNLMKQRWQS